MCESLTPNTTIEKNLPFHDCNQIYPDLYLTEDWCCHSKYAYQEKKLTQDGQVVNTVFLGHRNTIYTGLCFLEKTLYWIHLKDSGLRENAIFMKYNVWFRYLHF